MKKVVLSVVAALAVTAAPAFAADMPVKAKPIMPVAAPSPWDVAFGTSFATNYVLRGISQSDNKPSVSGYFEPRYNINPNVQLYVGLAGYSLWSGYAGGAATEWDLYGGVRLTFGALSFDFGLVYYFYPGATPDIDYLEGYAKAAYAVTDAFTLGANLTYSNDVANTGNTYYWISGTAKYVLPITSVPFGIYVSGELGYQAYDFAGPVDTTFWNAGIGFTYKAATLDLRYHDTDLSDAECVVTGGATNYCGAAYVAKLSFDTTLNSIK